MSNTKVAGRGANASEAGGVSFLSESRNFDNLPDLINRNRPVCRVCGTELVRSDRYYEPPFAAHRDTCSEHGAWWRQR